MAGVEKRRRYGVPLECPEDPRVIVRLLDKVKLNKETGCWVWTGYVNSDGYGILNLGRPVSKRFGHSRKNLRAYVHRLAFAIFKGRLDEGFDVHHTCHNRKCVRPEHLEAVDSWEHTRASGGYRPDVNGQELIMTNLPKNMDTVPF